MPSILLTNINRLSNKLNELSITCNAMSPSVVAITESWLSPDITDDAISLKIILFIAETERKNLEEVFCYMYAMI